VDRRAQAERAERFLALHHAPDVLLLPNVWDPLGARLLADLGYPAVATASAAVAWSRGRHDGERLPWETMLRAVRSIAGAVELPVTADIERGYAERLDGLAANVREVLQAGAVGINIEDSRAEGGALRPLDEQCERIRAVRRAAEELSIHLVINARIDLFLGGFAGTDEERLAEAVRRGRAYGEAGADCLYPIGPGDVATLSAVAQGTGLPVNAYAHAGTAPVAELRAAGIARLSVGPGLLKSALAAMRHAATWLRDRGSYEPFTEGVPDGSEVERLLGDEPR
jgi:2-methylisocitrate lyase-like PEP mutase family enzyme